MIIEEQAASYFYIAVSFLSVITYCYTIGFKNSFFFFFNQRQSCLLYKIDNIIKSQI